LEILSLVEDIVSLADNKRSTKDQKSDSQRRNYFHDKVGNLRRITGAGERATFEFVIRKSHSQTSHSVSLPLSFYAIATKIPRREYAAVPRIEGKARSSSGRFGRSNQRGTMSCPRLISRFHNFWRDFNAVNCWRFPELPPAYLLQSLNIDSGGVDHSEFIRAKWMWARKPKSLLGDGMSAYLLLIFLGLVLLLIPFAGIVLAPVWWLSMLLVIAKDTVRLARWRREYESSMCRVTRRCRKTK
jgi:hypothetical protein